MKRGEIPSIGGLTTFVAAAKHGSFTRAASELHLTQGAVSRQIRDIETRLGIRLFERVRQRIVLTDSGKVYLSSVKKALDDLADASQKVALFSSNTILSLVGMPTFCVRWLIPRLPAFQKANPTIIVNIATRQSPVDFAVEPFDAAVFHDASQWPGTMSHFLMDADVVAVCSPALNARRAIKAVADIAKFPLLHKIGKPTRWSECLTEAGLAIEGPLPGHAYENYAMIGQAAVSGLGIALLPRYLVEPELAAKRLEIVASGLFQPITSYYLIVPEARASAAPVRNFAKWLIAEAQNWSADDQRFNRAKAATKA